MSSLEVLRGVGEGERVREGLEVLRGVGEGERVREGLEVLRGVREGERVREGEKYCGGFLKYNNYNVASVILISCSESYSDRQRYSTSAV